MAAKGEVGIDLDVRRVPLREADMEPFEIMISESQERMLCVVEPERLTEVLAVCDKWEVNATAIGEVTDSGRLRVYDDGDLVGDLPVGALVDECPAYDLEPAPPAVPIYPRAAARARRRPGRRRDAAGAAGQRQPRLAPVGVRAVRLHRRLAHGAPARGGRRRGADARRTAARSRSRSTATGAASRSTPTAAPSRPCSSARPTSPASGAEPLGLTNCLNFGNPEKPHIAWQLTRAVAGLGDACRALGVPVVGGNVSLYNEGGGGPIYPTPVVGMVGELPDPARAGRLGFAAEGDAIALIAAGWSPAAAGSELAKLRGEAIAGELPAADLGSLRALHAAVRQGVRSGALRSAHDVAEGGLAVALAEACLARRHRRVGRLRRPGRRGAAVRRGPGRVRRLRARARR